MVAPRRRSDFWLRAARIAEATVLLVALGALLGFTCLTYLPPATDWRPTPPDASLWERIFPAVPVYWAELRLTLLAIGALVVGVLGRRHVRVQLSRAHAAAVETRSPSQPRLERIAFAISLGLCGAGSLAARFTERQDLLYFSALALPAIVLSWTHQRPSFGAAFRRGTALLIVPLLWLIVMVPLTWRSPRAANLVDMWIMVDRIEEVVHGHQSILRDSASPGHSNAYMILEGVPLLNGENFQRTFAQLQTSHAGWTAFTAFGLGCAAAAMSNLPVALVAQAALLFSPWGYSTLINPGMNQIAPLCTAWLLALAVYLWRRTSPAALAGYAVLAGFSGTEPTAVLLTVTATLPVAYTVLIERRYSATAVSTAILTGVAVLLPSWPSLETLRAMATNYTFGKGQLVAITEILLGQESVSLTKAALDSGRSQPVDIPIGALLAPFAIARTPIRLWGDGLFEPIATALAATGLVAAMFQRRRRTALLVVAMLLAGVLHGFTSRGDSVSHARLIGALIPLAILAGLGADLVARLLAWPGKTIAAAWVIAIATSGWYVSERLNPRLLPASWLNTALDAQGSLLDSGSVTILDHGMAWLYTDRITSMVPAVPLTTRTFASFEADPAPPNVQREQVFLWSPALEQDVGASCLICERWPNADLFILTDESGLFRAYAAATATGRWRPSLPTARWAATGCAPRCRRYGTPWLEAPLLPGLHCGEPLMSAES